MKRILAVLALTGVAALSLPAEVRVSAADAMKAATNKAQPQYPATARQMKITGQVEIEAVVNTAGEVESAKAVSGNPLLTGAAVSAVEKWKFTPFLSDGAPSKAIVALKFDFKP